MVYIGTSLSAVRYIGATESRHCVVSRHVVRREVYYFTIDDAVNDDNDDDFISNIHTYLQIIYLQVSYLQYHCCVIVGDQYSINAVFLLTPDDHQVCGRVCDAGGIQAKKVVSYTICVKKKVTN